MSVQDFIEHHMLDYTISLPTDAGPGMSGTANEQYPEVMYGSAILTAANPGLSHPSHEPVKTQSPRVALPIYALRYPSSMRGSTTWPFPQHPNLLITNPPPSASPFFKVKTSHSFAPASSLLPSLPHTLPICPLLVWPPSSTPLPGPP